MFVTTPTKTGTTTMTSTAMKKSIIVAVLLLSFVSICLFLSSFSIEIASSIIDDHPITTNNDGISTITRYGYKIPSYIYLVLYSNYNFCGSDTTNSVVPTTANTSYLADQKINNYTYVCRNNMGTRLVVDDDQSKHKPYMIIKIPILREEVNHPICYNIGKHFQNFVFPPEFHYIYAFDFLYTVLIHPPDPPDTTGNVDILLNETKLFSTDGSCSGEMWSYSVGNLPLYCCRYGGPYPPITMSYSFDEISNDDDDETKIPKIIMFQ
jgi:hypothetical protein